MTDVFAFHETGVFNPDFKLLTKMVDIDHHVLVHPAGVLSAVAADFGAPFLQHTSLHDNKGIHLVEHSSSVVLEVSLNDVELEVTNVPVDANLNVGLHHGLHHRLLHGGLHHGLLHGGLHGRAIVDELRAEVDTSSLAVTSVDKANPFLHATGAGKHLDGDFGMSDGLILAVIIVAKALNLEGLADVANLDVEMLHLPVGALVSVMAGG